MTSECPNKQYALSAKYMAVGAKNLKAEKTAKLDQSVMSMIRR